MSDLRCIFDFDKICNKCGDCDVVFYDEEYDD